MRVIIRLKGGAGSGNYGHAGRPGLVGGSGSGNGGSNGGARVYSGVKHTNFVSARNGLSKAKKKYVTQYTPEQMREQELKPFLASDKKSGFAISSTGELVSVFSLNDNGLKLVQAAIGQGAIRLDCFDGYLPGFYSKSGFREYKREANWTAGGPDIVYMRLED